MFLFFSFFNQIVMTQPSGETHRLLSGDVCQTSPIISSTETLHPNCKFTIRSRTDGMNQVTALQFSFYSLIHYTRIIYTRKKVSLKFSHYIATLNDVRSNPNSQIRFVGSNIHHIESL